jgi:hypothetical protein
MFTFHFSVVVVGHIYDERVEALRTSRDARLVKGSVYRGWVMDERRWVEIGAAWNWLSATGKQGIGDARKVIVAREQPGSRGLTLNR